MYVLPTLLEFQKCLAFWAFTTTTPKHMSRMAYQKSVFCKLLNFSLVLFLTAVLISILETQMNSTSIEEWHTYGIGFIGHRNVFLKMDLRRRMVLMMVLHLQNHHPRAKSHQMHRRRRTQLLCWCSESVIKYPIRLFWKVKASKCCIWLQKDYPQTLSYYILSQYNHFFSQITCCNSGSHSQSKIVS
jgi:hypothetical protein